MSSLLRAARAAAVLTVAVGGLLLTGTAIASAAPSATVTPAAPTFLDGACATNGADARVGEVITAADGVQYTVTDASGTTDLAPGFRAEAPASMVVVVASATAGNSLASGATTSWKHAFAADGCDTSSNGDDDTDVAPPPSFVDATCHTAGSVVIPDITDLQYYLGAAQVAAGRHPVAAGPLVVTARDLAGRTLVGTTSWTHTFTAAGGCATTAPTQEANAPSSAPRPAVVTHAAAARPALAATGGPLPVGPALLFGLGLIGVGVSLVRMGRAV